MFNKIRAWIANYIDLSEQLSTVFFGLVMVLTCTLGQAKLVEESEDETYDLLWGALGCNLAWGIITGIMFIMDEMFARARTVAWMRSVRSTTGDADALLLIQDELDSQMEPLTSEQERAGLYQDISRTVKNVEPAPAGFQRGDLIGAICVCWLVFLTAIPAVVPFLFINDRVLALRLSNLLSIAMLFLVGYCWGRATETNRWVASLGMTTVGIAAVGIAEALGG
jgi:hypothetical protein